MRECFGRRRQARLAVVRTRQEPAAALPVNEVGGLPRGPQVLNNFKPISGFLTFLKTMGCNFIFLFFFFFNLKDIFKTFYYLTFQNFEFH